MKINGLCSIYLYMKIHFSYREIFPQRNKQNFRNEKLDFLHAK